MMQKRKKAEEYNEALLPCVLPDSFALAESSGVDPVYMNTLNIAGDEMMGKCRDSKDQYQNPDLSHNGRRGFEKGAGHLELKFSSGWRSKYTCCYFCTPWTSECITLYRSGSAERGRSFSDPCIK